MALPDLFLAITLHEKKDSEQLETDDYVHFFLFFINYRPTVIFPDSLSSS
jgi:hypothetical protein